MRRPIAGWLAAALLVLGCADGRRYDQAICVLIDTSGTYVDQKAEVMRLVKRDLLPTMVPGDSLLVIRIDDQSYEKPNVVALVTLDTRPSQANAQKLALSKRLDEFVADKTIAPHTDIRGAMMLGAEYLRELGSGSRVMMIFSDLVEDLPGKARRALDPAELEHVDVMAVNVKRLTADGVDPGVFRKRVGKWEQEVEASKALSWRVFNDENGVVPVLNELRES